MTRIKYLMAMALAMAFSFSAWGTGFISKSYSISHKSGGHVAEWKYSGKKAPAFTFDGDAVGHIQTSAPEGVKPSFEVKLNKDTWAVTCTFKAFKDVESARMTLDFVVEDKASWWMIPAVSYNGNHWGRGNEPKGASEDGLWRTYSYRRTPIPGALYSEDEEYAVATWSDVPSKASEDFSCSIMPDSLTTTHRLIWPEEEQPVCYSSRDKYSDGFARKVSLRKGEEVTMTMYINVSPLLPEHRSMGTFLSRAWKSMPKPEIPSVNKDTVWNRGIDYFKHSLWVEKDGYTGFTIGIMLLPEEGWHRCTGYESGWCGQNISIAISMLEDYLKNGSQESLDKGMKTLDCWARDCRLPNGLFIVNYDRGVLKHNPDYVIDACNLGTTATNYIEAYSIAAKCGFDRPEYLDIAYAACDFAISHQREDGCYARGWYMDGRDYVREGTIGCFIVPAMIAAYKQSGKQKYLDSAKKAFSYYMGELLRDGYSTAGALDTWCIDKESSVSLLRSAMRLYSITNDKSYLSDAEQVSYYLSSWLWHYDGIYPAEDAFTTYSWHTFGATSVSAQHNHLDLYAAYWILEWIELSRLTGDSQWKEKAIAIWNNSCQLISDGSLVMNGLVRPRGSQNEAYFESAWGFDDTVDGTHHDGAIGNPERINNWLVAWPGAFRLESLRHAGSEL